MTKNFLTLTAFLFFSMVFIACEKDDPIIPNEEELITTVNYTLSPANGGNDIVLSFVDLDGDGGSDPIITGGTLAANQLYTGRLDLLNEAESPAESITEEIVEEDEDHQFFFESTINGMSISYTDQDANGNPVGLNTSIMTGGAATGSIKVILKHEPNKNADGVSDGDDTNAGGETDIQVIFPIDVQ